MLSFLPQHNTFLDSKSLWDAFGEKCIFLRLCEGYFQQEGMGSGWCSQVPKPLLLKSVGDVIVKISVHRIETTAKIGSKRAPKVDNCEKGQKGGHMAE